MAASTSGQINDERAILGSVLAHQEPMRQWAEIRQKIPHCLIFPTREGRLLAYAFDSMMRDGVIPSLRQSITYLRQVDWQQAWEDVELGAKIARSGGMSGTSIEQQLSMLGEWKHGKPERGLTILDALGGVPALSEMVEEGNRLKRDEKALTAAVTATLSDYRARFVRMASNRLQTALRTAKSHEVDNLVNEFALSTQRQECSTIAPLESFEEESKKAFGRGTQCAVWGVEALDRLYPLAQGKLYTLSAPPSHGKSTLALQAAVSTAGHIEFGTSAQSVLYVSLEMTGGELLAKAKLVMPRQEGVGYTSRVEGIVIHKPGRAINEAYTINELLADIQFVHASSGGGLRLVVVDYIGKLDFTDERSTENIELGKITGRLKSAALALDIAILQLAQMNREGRKEQRDKDGNVTAVPEPRMGDLRGSGKIEDDSDLILFLWPQEIDRGRDMLRYRFKCAKYRCGPQIHVDGYFEPAESHFSADYIEGPRNAS